MNYTQFQQLWVNQDHLDTVRALVFGPGLIAAGSADRNVSILDPQTGRRIMLLNDPMLLGYSHRAAVYSVAIHPNGTYIASGGADGTTPYYDRNVTLWYASNGTKIRTFNDTTLPYPRSHGGGVNAIAFSPNGTWLASGSGGTSKYRLKLWNVTTGRLMRRLSWASSVQALAFSPNGSWLAAGHYDKNITLWDMHTGKFLKRLTAHNGAVYSLDFSPDGSRLISGSADNTARLWNVTDWSNYTFATFGTDVRAVRWNPVEDVIAISSGTKAYIYSSTGVRLKALDHTHSVYALSWSKDTVRLISGAGDKSVRCWCDRTAPVVMAVNLSPRSPTNADIIAIRITFNEDMDTRTALNLSAGRLIPYTEILGIGHWYSLREWRGTLETVAHPDGIYILNISQACDISGNIMVPNTAFSFVLDRKPPNIVVANIKSPVSVGIHNITLTFDEDMNTAVALNVRFGVPPYYNTFAAKYGSWADSRRWRGMLEINATVPDGKIRLNISAGTDMAGNLMRPDTAHTFVVDKVAPQILHYSPCGTNVRVSSVIVMNFSETMNLTSTEHAFTLRAKDRVSGSFRWKANNTSMEFLPSDSLAFNTTYTASVGQATDIAGNMLSHPVVWLFTTELATVIKKYGDSQHGTVNSMLQIPFVIRVETTNGMPVANSRVVWSIVGAPPDTQNCYLAPATSITNETGDAKTSFHLGTKTGVYVVSANVSGAFNSPLFFTAIALPGTLHHVNVYPPKIMLRSHETQRFTASGCDEFGNNISGLSFNWSCSEGLGTITSDGNFTAGSRPITGFVNATTTYNGVTRTGCAEVTVIISGKKTGAIIGTVSTAVLRLPISGVEVRVCYATNKTLAGSTITDENGRYYIANLLPGNYIANASKPGYRPNEQIVTVTEDNESIANFELELSTSLGLLTGFVYDRAARPVANATVSVNLLDKGLVIRNVTVSTGRFWLELLPGQYRVTVTKEGYETISDTVDISAGTITTKNYTLVEIPVQKTSEDLFIYLGVSAVALLLLVLGFVEWRLYRQKRRRLRF